MFRKIYRLDPVFSSVVAGRPAREFRGNRISAKKADFGRFPAVFGGSEALVFAPPQGEAEPRTNITHYKIL
jgi:hypothetical protein